VTIERKKGMPRPAGSYRGARRNARRAEFEWVDGRKVITRPRQPWVGIEPAGRLYHPPVRPNRSRKWDEEEATWWPPRLRD
jgi:hypothetical protein